MKKHLSVWMVCLLVAAAWGSPAGARADSSQYRVTDLTNAGGASFFSGYALNNSGQVAGSDYGTGDVLLYSNGTVQDMGNPNPGCINIITGLNSRGEVIGYSAPPNTPNTEYAFYYSGGSQQSIPFLYPSPSSAWGINDSSQIVGQCYLYHSNCFLYSGGVVQALAPSEFSPFIYAMGINDNGQVAGTHVWGGNSHACLYTAGVTTDLGTLPGGTYSEALAINANGDIAGYADTKNHATDVFLYSNGVMHDLGVLPYCNVQPSNKPLQINASGQVVGFCMDRSGNYYPFLYKGNGLQNLNQFLDPSLGLTILSADALNDKGQILAWGRNSANAGFCALLTPLAPGDFNEDGNVDDADYTIWADYFKRTPPTNYHCGDDASGGYDDADYTNWADNFTGNTTSVPEPVTLSFLALGGVALLKRRRVLGS